MIIHDNVRILDLAEWTSSISKKEFFIWTPLLKTPFGIGSQQALSIALYKFEIGSLQECTIGPLRSANFSICVEESGTTNQQHNMQSIISI